MKMVVSLQCTQCGLSAARGSNAPLLCSLGVIDAQTLKHHADDLIGVGNKALENLLARESFS